MCGIFGSINFALDDSEVKQSLLSINHRGPDSNGIFRDNNHNYSSGIKVISAIPYIWDVLFRVVQEG